MTEETIIAKPKAEATHIAIGCKLPNGLELAHPETGETFVVKGLNSIVIIGATHVTTQVPVNFWNAWYEKNKAFPALKSGALFAANSASDAAAVAKELSWKKTGLEPMSQTAGGVKPANGD